MLLGVRSPFTTRAQFANVASRRYRKCDNEKCPQRQVKTRDGVMVDRLLDRDVAGACNILAAGIVALISGRLPLVFDARASKREE